MRRWLILHETGFLARSFSHPTLLTVESSSRYKIYYLYGIQLFVSELIEYEDQGPRFVKKKSRNVMSMVPHLVITDNIMDAHQKTHLHTMKVYNTRLVCPPPHHPIKVLLIKMTLFFWRLKCLLAPKYSKLSSDRTLGMTHPLHWSFQSFLLKKCMALWKNFICCQSHALHCSRLSVTSRCLSPVFTVSARNTWDQLIPF